jgi:hypothetical protein
MRRGTWHQFGDRSQKLALEQLQNGTGVGVILSPRDLALNRAIEYASEYRKVGAEVLVDQQFHIPDFTNAKIESYPTNPYRMSVSQLKRIGDLEIVDLASALRMIHSDLSADGVISPAVVYEAGRQDIVDLNKRLFGVAKRVGDELGIPTYATIVLGRSATATDQTLFSVLSQATSLSADGWYYAIEFDEDRLPSSLDAVFRCCKAGLMLACTGKPVLHGYAGPLALLSLGFGCTGAAVGHSQNLWGFNRERWQTQRAGGGGGGDAPPRFFSAALWGTIIYPDEIAMLQASLQRLVITSSPYSSPVSVPPISAWNRWDANKHLVHIICSTIDNIAAASSDARDNARSAIDILQSAVSLHSQIATSGTSLKDGTNTYQSNWLSAMTNLLRDHKEDFDYLELL